MNSRWKWLSFAAAHWKWTIFTHFLLLQWAVKKHLHLWRIKDDIWRVQEEQSSDLYIVFPSNYFLFFLGRRRAERAPQCHSQESDSAKKLQATEQPGADCQRWHTTVARKQTWNWDSLSAKTFHPHRWCRLCWCCALWLAPGRCPADRDAPGMCQPCWHPAAGAGWKSLAVSSPLSSAWCELWQQRERCQRGEDSHENSTANSTCEYKWTKHLKRGKKIIFVSVLITVTTTLVCVKSEEQT